MDAVILFSHGALLCGAGEALLAHARRLQARGVAPVVEVGYLNYSEPPFAEAVANVVAQGATVVRVAPYFLVPGKFIKVDLPEAIAAAKAAHPGVEFVVAEPLGFDELLADALIASAQSAQGPERWRDALRDATAHCRPNPECPLYGTPACQKAPGMKEGETYLTQRRRDAETREKRVGPMPDTRTPIPSSLLVMVHGSPRPIANEAMFRVVDVVKRRGVFPIVEVGFMECNAPSIPDAIAACVAQGAREIVAVPYFLHTGTHVADDLPTLLEEGQAAYPDVRFRMGEYLGRSEILTDILAQRLEAVSQSPT